MSRNALMIALELVWVHQLGFGLPLSLMPPPNFPTLSKPPFAALDWLIELRPA